MPMTKADYWFLVMLICTLSLKFPDPGIMDYVLSILSMILFAGSWVVEWLEGRKPPVTWKKPDGPLSHIGVVKEDG